MRTTTRAEDGRLGLTVHHRRYVPGGRVHHGTGPAGVVDAAWLLGLFGDAATEMCIRTDQDTGLLAAYHDVRFAEPVRPGDVVDVRATVIRVGDRSRDLALEACVVCRARPDLGPTAARALDVPLLACSATATVVVPRPSPA